MPQLNGTSPTPVPTSCYTFLLAPAKKSVTRPPDDSAAKSTESAAPPATPAKLPQGTGARVFLIDAMGFIFRAYHAMARQRPMSTRTGIPTAATYVFVNMLNKLIQDFKPEHVAAVFDLAGPTFRDERAKGITSVKKWDSKTQQFAENAYAGYKAQRAEMPPDLTQQIPYIRRALEAYRIPILSYEGFEADDVIGTLARQAADAGHPVYVVSSDKDMLQLVNDRVCVLNPPKDNLICDAAKVEEILGVPPRQVVDVMALRGDSIDNIPGAPGIGDKGSVEIIRRFGTVENALDHADEVERKTYRESLLNNRDVVMLSKELATIDVNVPVQLDLAGMTAQAPDLELARSLFSELEFTTLLKEILPATDLGKTEYTELKTAAQWKRLLATAGKTGLALAFAPKPSGKKENQNGSVENEGTNEEPQEQQMQSGDLFALAAEAEGQTCSSRIGLSADSSGGYEADLSGPLAKEIQAGLEDASLTKAIHDFKAALHACADARISLAGVEHDTMLYSYLLDPTFTSHSLANVALRRFNLKISDSVAQWADLTGRLSIALRKEVEEADLLSLYHDIDLPLAPVLARMEAAGVKVDTASLADMSERLERECNAKTREIHQAAGEKFNVNSPRQLGEVLFNKMGLPKPVKYGKGKTISTAVDVLEELAADHPIARMVLDYRQLSKLKSTYVDAIPAMIDPRTGRVHTTLQQAATSTGRLSSINPNLQNIPIRTDLGRQIRAAFIAEPGNLLLAADYSQIELRLLAHFSADRLLTEAFRQGQDIHSLTAQQVFGEVNAENRRRAKVINFGIAYGMSPFGLSQELGIESKEARAYIDAYFEKYSGVRSFIDSTIEQCRREGYVKTLFGRVRPIPDIQSKNPNMRGFAERTAVNTPLQGTAADLIKLAMIRIDAEIRQRKLRSRMTLQVHDELVFEVPEAELEEIRALVEDKMQNVYALSVPIVVDIGVGKNWRDAK